MRSENKGKKKKAKNPRAAFLSAFMKRLSGDEGERAIVAFANGDKAKLKAALSTLVGNLVEGLDNASTSRVQVFRGKKLISTSEEEDDEVVLLERKRVK